MTTKNKNQNPEVKYIDFDFDTNHHIFESLHHVTTDMAVRLRYHAIATTCGLAVQLILLLLHFIFGWGWCSDASLIIAGFIIVSAIYASGYFTCQEKIHHEIDKVLDAMQIDIIVEKVKKNATK